MNKKIDKEKMEIKLLQNEIFTIFERARKEEEPIRKKIDFLKRELEKNCPHTKTEIVRDNYFEPGKMEAPHWFQKKKCKRCGKTLDRTTIKELWADGTEAY